MEKKLIAWSLQGYSALPWRKERSLYRTLVSEIMLQQTTVQTVVNHFDKFLNQYPSIKSLANSSEKEICMAWKGLGYYRRARNLRFAAIEIQKNFKSRIPTDFETLMAIPGIGIYTANAILAIGANKPALALDANLERVLSRYFWVEIEKGPKLQKELYRLFSEGKLFSKRAAFDYRDLNEALMDLGRVYCRANKSDCLLCPISKNCQAFKRKEPLVLPKLKAAEKNKEKHELELLRVVVVDKKKIYTIQRAKGEWLEGQLETPTFVIKTTDKKFTQYPKLATKKIKIAGLASIKSSITKYKIKNHILELTKREFKAFFPNEIKGLSPLDTTQSNFSSTTLKVLKKLDFIHY